MNIWLIGAGPHAREYAKVLINRGIGFDVVGRGTSSVAAFQAETGHPARAGGLVSALEGHTPPETAIVAVSFECLAGAAIQLIESGTKRILLEKPGGLSVQELEAVGKSAAKHQADVLLAYNRRFYASTIAATRMIAEDGGPTSCNFEFTEWAHTIAPAPLSADTKQAWLLANSSHVIDLAFHICGFPKEWKGWHAGTLDWHRAASRFCGAGVTDRGVLFSYHANWDAPGRWALEVLTRKRRFIFKPMEQLQVTHLASVKTEPVEIDDQIDKTFKPGWYEETRAFLAGDDALFCTVAEQLEHAAIYSAMAGYAGTASGIGSRG